MGKKSKSSAKKSRARNKPKRDQGQGTRNSELLISNAEAALSQMQIENALGYFEEALCVDPSNSYIMDSLADIYLTVGETGRANELLLKSAEINPNDNPGKYLYIAQLQHGGESLHSYQVAVQMLTSNRLSEESYAVIDKQIIKAYCGIAELYMTDLCYDDNAEQSCEENILKALSIDPTSVDANHALANLRLSQNKPVDAAEIVQTTYQKIHDIRDKIRARTIVDDLNSPENVDIREDIDADIPNLDMCISLVKLMIECASVKPTLADDALVFSAELLDDDDENIELWYIAGVAAMTTSPPDFSTALYYLENARSKLDSIKEIHGEQSDAMSEHYSLITEHIAMINSQKNEELVDKEQLNEKIEEWSSDEEDGAHSMDIS